MKRPIRGKQLAGVIAGIGASTALALGASASQSAPATLTVTLTAQGTVEAPQQLELSFSAPGRLIALDVQPGQQVAAGELLAQLDPTAAKAALETAAANLSSARAQLIQLEQGLSPTERRQLQITLGQSKTVVTSANQSLHDTRDAATEDAKRLQTAVAQARTQLSGDQTRLSTDQTTYNGDQTTLTSDQGTLSSAGTQVASDRRQLGDDEARLLSDQKQQVDDSAASASAATLAGDAKTILDDQAAVAADQSKLTDDAGSMSDARSAVVTDQSRLASDRQTLEAAQDRVTTDENALTVATNAQNAGTVAQRQLLDSAASALEGARRADAATRAENAVHLQPPRLGALAAARAAVRVADASVVSAEQTLHETRLIAPFAGTIASVEAVVGQLVSQQGTSALITLVDLNKLTISASFGGAEAALIAAGQPATITVPALADATAAGRVVAVDPLPSPATTTAGDTASANPPSNGSATSAPPSAYSATIGFSDDLRSLRPGMQVEVAVQASTRLGSGRNAGRRR